jgi:glyoxylase I family protein
MIVEAIHHVAVVTRDLPRSLAFYRDVVGLVPVERPDFDLAGAWLRAGAAEVHLIVNLDGTYRSRRRIDGQDAHFAVRVRDFEAMVARLHSLGYREDASSDDQRRMVVKRESRAGFPQIFVLDPDGHVVEINAAA